MRKTQVNIGKNTQKIMSCVSLTKEAHMTEQTDQPSLSTDEPDRGTHLVVTHAKAVARGSQGGVGRPHLEASHGEFWREG